MLGKTICSLNTNSTNVFTNCTNLFLQLRINNELIESIGKDFAQFSNCQCFHKLHELDFIKKIIKLSASIGTGFSPFSN